MLIAVKLNIQFDKLDSPSLIEACTISLELDKNKQLILICFYRPPQANITYQRNLCDFIVDKVKHYPNAIFCCTGDFNLPDINWGSESIVSCQYYHEINEMPLDMSAECAFTQVVVFPTRQTNILDLFFTNRPSIVQTCNPLPGISDHDITLVNMNLEVTY